MSIEIPSGTADIVVITVQTLGALSPFIISYLLWRVLKKVRLRFARKYFEHVKNSEYWPEISKRKFMQEAKIYAYDFEELTTPGEHFLHPCIRGLRERQMYEELPGLERIRNRFCWSIRVMAAVWVASFFAAFYFSAMSLVILGDAAREFIICFANIIICYAILRHVFLDNYVQKRPNSYRAGILSSYQKQRILAGCNQSKFYAESSAV